MLGWTEFLIIVILIVVVFHFRKSFGMESLSSEEEREIGASIVKKLSVQKERDKRIRTIFNKLKENADLKFPHYRLYRLDSSEINAMAILGGHIITTDGFASLHDTSDDEIAGVLAHEIAHVELGHSRDAYYRENRTKVLKAALAILGRGVGKVGGVVEHLSKLGVNRESELAADRLAIKLLSRSSYSAKGLLEFLQRAKQLEELPEWVGFLSTHPAVDERMRRLKEMF